MSTVNYKQEIYTHEDSEGNITQDKKETRYKKVREPDYIKLYTKLWCEFNGIPDTFKNLFLELALRMSYCNAKDLDNSQIVYTGGTVAKDIMRKLGWSSKRMYQKGLKALCECDAIRKVARAEYQINPSYAGRGAWMYNPQENQGGVKDLVAKFNFKDKTVDTQIIWADDGSNSELNKSYIEGLEVKKEDETVLTSTEIRPKKEEKKEEIA